MLGWIIRLLNASASNRSARKPRRRLTLEYLEGRCLPSANVLQTNLVSDLPGAAQKQDARLINPWGISEAPNGPFWLSNNNSGFSTLYDGSGVSQQPTVSIPTPGQPLGAAGTPTGTVFNNSNGFKVSNGSSSAAAVFLFATEDGTIVGWNPGVNPPGFAPAKAGTYGILAVDNSGNNFTQPDPNLQTGAVYKGLATATSANAIFSADAASTSVLYAANFRSGQVEVYDTNFGRVTLPQGGFADAALPSGYAPFNVQVLGGKLYVAYAVQNTAKHDDVGGLGNGVIDVFNLDGTPGLANGKVRLVTGGALDSPWGLSLAPASFGNLSGALLVGNFKNGHINVFDAATGGSLGQLTDATGQPIQINGLWALHVGNGNGGGDPNSIYFTAGINREQDGLFGSLTPTAAAEAFFTLKTDGSLTQNDTGGGSQLLSPAGTIQSISAVTDGGALHDVFAITADRHLWEHTPAGWSLLSTGAFQQISAATNSSGAAVVFAVLTDNSLWENNPAFGGSGWKNLSPAGTILSVSAVTDQAGDDVAFAITAGRTLWEHSPALPGNGWTELSSGSFQQVSAGRNAAGQAVVFGVLTDDSLWENNPAFGNAGHWQLLSPAGTILSISAGGPDSVFAITADHHLWEHTAAGWAMLSSGSFASVSATENAAGQGDVFATLTDNSLWVNDPALPGNHWMELLLSGVAAGAGPQRL
jgi:uncharacterized protein (TIGR03118 family)